MNDNRHTDLYRREINEGDMVAVCFSNKPYIGIVTQITNRTATRIRAQITLIERGWRVTNPWRVRRQTKYFYHSDIIKVGESSLSPEVYARLMQEADRT